jgi:hypothetical protein
MPQYLFLKFPMVKMALPDVVSSNLEVCKNLSTTLNEDCCTLNFETQKTNYYTRRGVSKQVTNGSKTAVMDVIGFLCVSLCNNTFQLCDSLGSRGACTCSEAGFSSQNGDRA